ncbi:MAG: hypothetical protein HQK51_21030, partial [Oligoflexia bacterium]|nr:hypothetical protein [Oligoflexia bacterium]
LITVPAFWMHVWYVHTNMIAGIYYSLSVLTVFLYRKNLNVSLVFLAAILLGFSSLIRAEMVFLASIPIALLMNTKELNRKYYGIFITLFIIICFFWKIYKLIYLGLSTHHYGAGYIDVILFTAYLSTFFIVYNKNTKLKIASIAPELSMVVLFFLLLCAFVVNFSNPIQQIIYLGGYLILPLSEHDWGGAWIISGLFITINMWLRKGFENTSNTLKYFIVCISSFFLFRILFYSIQMAEGGLSPYCSGNRMLISVLPLCVFHMFYFLAVMIDSYQIKNYLIKGTSF